MSAITHPNEEQTRVMLNLHDYKYLDYINGWGDTYPPEYTRCKNLGHKINDKQHNDRGSNCTYWCHECKIFYKVDMSD